MRPRAEILAQTQYSDGIVVQWGESSGEFSASSVGILTTRSFVGGTPQTWDIVVPDMSSAGYDPSWGLQTTSYEWSVTAFGSDAGSPLLGQVPSNGATTRSSSRSNGGEVIVFERAGASREAQAFARARAALLKRLIR